MALDQERTLSIFIVSKFEYAQCIGGRPVKLKTISRGVCRFRFLWFHSLKFMSIHFTMSKNANIGEKAVYCLLYFSVSQRWYSFKWLFYNLNGVLRCSFWVMKQILKFRKWLCYLRTNTIATRRIVTSDSRLQFAQSNRSRKNDQVYWTLDNEASRRNSTKMAAPLFRRIKRNIFGFWSY